MQVVCRQADTLHITLDSVPGGGIEPPRPQWPQDFKSCVSTSSTIRASAIDALSEKKPSSEGLYFRAKDGIRTRDPNLGKVMLYQLSYFRVLKGLQNY